MTMHQDQRVVELEELAREEGLTLPMPADMIAFLERQGRIVDLVTGEVYANVTVATTPSAQAVAYLLSAAVGELVI